ncbi:hypothetical protein MMC06_002131 [Schaereria dolodes]|nr:hypothetical protein [Schaereria dolodes]
MAHGQYTEPTDIEGSWQTLFRNDTDTYKITFSLFLLGIVNGSLHLVCLTISLYLAIIFRKIAQLPPDLNPLEDNLTSRHKRNKSSLSTTQTTTNRDSHLSDPLIGPPRVVPFMHTRTESSTSLSSPERRLPNSNRASRTDLPSQIYQQPPSQRASRADVANFSTPHSPTKRSTMYADSRPASARPSSTRPPSTRPQSAHPSLLNDNWFTYPSPSPTPALPETIPAEFRHLRAQSQSNQAPLRNPNIENLTPNPLEMNPPTPPNLIGNDRSVEQRALTAATGNSNLNPNLYKNLNFNPGFPVNSSNSHQVAKPGLNSRPQSARLDSFGTAGSKARFYGELIGTMPREGRVVSSGADAGGKDQSQQQGRGGMRARDVSGKIVEEGRGNGGEYAYRGVEGDGFGERLWRRGNGVAF